MESEACARGAETAPERQRRDLSGETGPDAAREFRSCAPRPGQGARARAGLLGQQTHGGGDVRPRAHAPLEQRSGGLDASVPRRDRGKGAGAVDESREHRPRRRRWRGHATNPRGGRDVIGTSGRGTPRGAARDDVVVGTPRRMGTPRGGGGEEGRGITTPRGRGREAPEKQASEKPPANANGLSSSAAREQLQEQFQEQLREKMTGRGSKSSAAGKRSSSKNF